jgi:hypothetical protein
MKSLETRDIDATLRDRLLQLLPDLGDVAHSCGTTDYFTSRDAADRILTSHAIEHVAVVLQNLSGSELMCVRSNSHGGLRDRGMILAYEESEVCDAAAQVASDLIELLRSSPPERESAVADKCTTQIDSFQSTARRRRSVAWTAWMRVTEFDCSN